MARKPQDNPQLDMTPMIDVVFELIIFFVVTIKQEDIFSQLNANRPQPGESNSPTLNDNSVTIQLGERYDKAADGVILYNHKEVSRIDLNRLLGEIARTNTQTPIIIKASGESPHKALVDVLDICYRNKLFSVSIFTL